MFTVSVSAPDVIEAPAQELDRDDPAQRADDRPLARPAKLGGRPGTTAVIATQSSNSIPVIGVHRYRCPERTPTAESAPREGRSARS